MALVFGIGIGLFILIILWSVTLLGCFILARGTNSSGGIFGLGFLAAIVTAILILFPRASQSEAATLDNTLYDEYLIGRSVLLGVMSLFSIICLLLMVVFHWMEPVYAIEPKKSLY
ncbi:Transmembrane protein 218 [Trichoplax sp. H2]|nr:Transmembrane protein 218 [Trichoplax sp. H2]|eukprot:RDD46035.1 Transmembrane protein 218 [Trichoplax sp. H2]